MKSLRYFLLGFGLAILYFSAEAKECHITPNLSAKLTFKKHGYPTIINLNSRSIKAINRDTKWVLGLIRDGKYVARRYHSTHKGETRRMVIYRIEPNNWYVFRATLDKDCKPRYIGGAEISRFDAYNWVAVFMSFSILEKKDRELRR